MQACFHTLNEWTMVDVRCLMMSDVRVFWVMGIRSCPSTNEGKTTTEQIALIGLLNNLDLVHVNAGG